MSVHLPRRWHSAAFSQNANLKTTLLLGKLHNIVKFPQLFNFRMQTIKSSRPSQTGFPIMCILLWSGIATPPWLLVSVTLAAASKGAAHTTDPWVTWRQVTWPGKGPRMPRFMNSHGEGRESATNRPGVCTLRFKNSSFFWDGYSHELATHEKGGTCLLLE